VAGCDLRRDARGVRRRIGFVAQGGASDPVETGRRELILQARLYGMNRAQAAERAAETLRLLELEAAADRRTATYSGGQRRRLDLGLGLIHRPTLLFLDEPTTGLDPQSRTRLWEEVRALRRGGVTVFLTTHYLEEADILCDRLAIIDHGRIVASGTPDELKRSVAGDAITLSVAGAREEDAMALLDSRPFVRQAAVDRGSVRLYVDAGERAMPEIIRLLDGAGIALTTIAMARPSLDDVFLHHTGRSLREQAA